MKEHIQEMIDDQAMIDEKKFKLLKIIKSDDYKKMNNNEQYLIVEQFKCMEKLSDILDSRLMEAS